LSSKEAFYFGFGGYSVWKYYGSRSRSRDYSSTSGSHSDCSSSSSDVCC
jgi:hypothetical protein